MIPTMSDDIIKALKEWKADSDQRFPWAGGKPQPVIAIPLSAVLIDRAGDSAYIAADDIINAFTK